MLESSHQEYINNILEYNFDYCYEIQARKKEVQKEILRCEEELTRLRRIINRVPYFENFLTELLENNEINQIQKQAIILISK